MSRPGFSFGGLPIRAKLTILSMAATLLALFIAYIFSAAGRTAIEWSAHEEEMRIKAEIIGSNSVPAVLRLDSARLGRALSTLKVDRSIRMAAIYGADGTALAVYRREGEPPLPVPPRKAEGISFSGLEVYYFKDIYAEGAPAGAVFLLDDMKDFFRLIGGYLLVTLAAALASAGVAYIFWTRAQELITVPIDLLAESIRAVSSTRDYSLRVKGGGVDEMGTLIAGFNEMLGQIQERDRKLEAHSHFLEDMVAQRTSELRDKNEALRTELAERMRIESAFRRERELLLHGPVVAFKLRTDPGWPVEYISPNISQFQLNAPMLAGEGASFLSVIFPEDRERITADAARLLRGDCESFEGEYRLIGGQGRIYWVDITAVAARGARGGADNIDGYILDITDRKLNEVALQEARTAAEAAALELKNTLLVSEDLRAETEKAKDMAEQMAVEAAQASEAKSEFMANMSHELRTPLNGVIGLTEVLLRSGISVAQRRKLEMIRFSGNVLLNLVNDILDLSRIEAGKMTLSHAEFSPRMLVEDTLSQYALAAGDKGLELVADVAESVPESAMGDPMRLNQVINNLVGNAVKFTHQGEVTVGVELAETGPDRFTLLFRVRDTGIGVPEDQLEKIFARFTQADPSITRKYGGAGLGVTISRQLVEKMGGRIWVESRLGQGSTFMFTIALEPGASRPAEAVADTALAGKRILVVDDNASSAAALARLARILGMDAVVCSEGAQALAMAGGAAAEGRPFEAALLDLGMPGLSGPDLARKMALVRGGPAPKMVILYPPGAEPEDAGKLKGVDGALSKPVRKAEFEDTLTRLFAAAAAGAPAADTAALQRQKQLRILLAEDNPVNQEVAVSMLKAMGHAVDLAANGVQAVKMWSSAAYDAALMDVQMPEMDGLTATKIIRGREGAQRARRTPIIAMTAHAMEGDREKCLAAGMDGYLAKPISMESLAEALAMVPAGAAPGPAKPVPCSTGGFSVRMVERLLGLPRESAWGLMNKFAEISRKNIKALKDAMAGGDPELALRMAHSIKGSALQVGATAMGRIAERLEAMGAAGILSEDAAKTAAELEAEFESVETGMRSGSQD